MSATPVRMEEQPETSPTVETTTTTVSTKQQEPDDVDQHHHHHQHSFPHPDTGAIVHVGDYVDHGTLSTTEAAKLMNGLNLDESVVSGITDHTSLECPSTTALPPHSMLMMNGHDASSSSSSACHQEVPKQVILADEQTQHQQESSLPDDDGAYRHHQTPSDIPLSYSYASQEDTTTATGGGGGSPTSLVATETAATSVPLASAATAPGVGNGNSSSSIASPTPVTATATTATSALNTTSTDVPRTIPATSSSPQRGGEHHRSISMIQTPSPQRGAGGEQQHQQQHNRSISMTEGMPIGATSAASGTTAVSPQKVEQQQQQYSEQRDRFDEDTTNDDRRGDGGNGGGHDNYIQSPEIQNAIVERSPGGRYVRFMEKLGSGASKDVYRAYDTQEGIEVAWNVVTLSGVPKTERNRIVNEVRLLERLHHHNIISFHGSWVNRERQEVNFVTEILSSGTLKSFINKVQVIRWKIAKRWGVQILKGLEYLHSQQPPVIHRDLKCENIFINGTSGDLRIGDLGLSTVHRNGRVLSVLGTPEFMAPDMYEEDSYDEKVDIYAFGMVMLEIFTKQIPYSECSNPAQIYKKVSAGEPPEILPRLQSRHAREFVMLCLGHRDENGKYVRPSASELLQHPFLERRPTDDDEVVVEKPLRERAIVESGGGGGETSSSTSPDATPSSTTNRKVYVDIHQQGGGFNNAPGGMYNNNSQASQNAVSNSSSNPAATPPPPPRRKSRLNSFEEDDDGDRFDEMPESETNMKKVKVLMGRGQELQEDDDAVVEPSVGMDDSANVNAIPRGSSSQQQHQQAAATTTTGDASNAHQAQQTQQQQQQHDQQTQYLVAAAVIENEAMIVRPYADDILKLVVTLPVEGQTQNVQFDFHLVLDDPVQVAKEMVRELGIPQAAVLEISETISGLACAARMKQEKHSVSVQQQQQQQQQLLMPQVAPSAPAPIGVQNGSQQEIPHTLSQVSSSSPIPDYGANVVLVGNAPAPPVHLGIPDASTIATQNQAAGPPPVYAPLHNASPYTTTASAQVVAAQEPQVSQQQYGQVSVGASQAPVHNANVVAPQPQAPAVPVTHVVHGLPPAPAAALSAQQAQPQTVVGVQPGLPVAIVSNAAIPSNHVSVAWQQQLEAVPQAPASGPSSPSQGSRLPPNQQPVEQDAAVPFHPSPRSTPKTPNGAAPADRYSADDTDSDDDDDDELNDELRKLEEDFHKNLERTKKVFDSRMDNLARSQIEREAQHLKTLEKHEKERAEFEKRRAIEEEQQQRRLEQLQKEWDKKRETLAQHKRKHHAHMTGGTDQEPQPEQQQQQQKMTISHVPKNGSHYNPTDNDSQERAPLGNVPQPPGNPSRNISTPVSTTTNVNISSPHPSENKQQQQHLHGSGQAPNGGLDR